MFSPNKSSAVHEKPNTPRSCLRWKSTGRIFKTAGLRWIPTGKMFTNSPTKVDNEPPNGSNEDITNLYECDQTLDVSASTLNLSAGTSFNPNKERLRVWLLKGLISQKLGVQLKYDEHVWIRQKSQENRQKRANTDTRTEECARAGSQNQKSQPSGKTRGFSQLKGDLDNSREDKQDGKVNEVISRHSLAHLAKECHVEERKAQGLMKFTLSVLSKEAQSSNHTNATLTIRLKEGELTMEELPWILLAYLRISQSL
ncbi:hypothetical protein Tco_1197086 [Tanacetum coccineum]